MLRRFVSPNMRSWIFLFASVVLFGACTDAQKRALTGDNTPSNTGSIAMNLVSPTSTSADGYYEVNEADGSFSLTFKLSQPAPTDFKVLFTVKSDTVTEGLPAKLSKDYIVDESRGCQSELQCQDTGTREVKAGQVDIIIGVGILNDAFYEGDESFYIGIQLERTVAGVVYLPKYVFDVRIKDDETQPPNFVFAANQAQIIDVNEGTGIATLKIISTTSYSDRFPYKIPITYSAPNGTAGATADEDFVATKFFTVVPAQNVGSTPDITFQFQVNDDVIAEQNESIVVTMGNPEGATVGSVNTVIFQIIDDDGGGATKLNSTGITLCTKGTPGDTGTPCSLTSTTYPGQDGETSTIFDESNFTKLISKNNPAINSAWNCVVDNRTGLVWEAKSPDSAHANYYNYTYAWYDTRSNVNGGESGIGGTSSSSTSTSIKCANLGKDACDTQHYIDKLNNDGFCGYKTWRLPRLNELISLLNLSSPNPPFLPAAAFNPTGVETGVDSITAYWTATPVAGDSKLAWGVRFGALKDTLDTMTVKLNKDSYHYIRLVTGQ